MAWCLQSTSDIMAQWVIFKTFQKVILKIMLLHHTFYQVVFWDSLETLLTLCEINCTWYVVDFVASQFKWRIKVISHKICSRFCLAMIMLTVVIGFIWFMYLCYLNHNKAQTALDSCNVFYAKLQYHIRITQCGIGDIDPSDVETSGPRFNIKVTSYQYRKSHCEDKTVVRSSYLHSGISYTGKKTSLYWIRALVLKWGYSWGTLVTVKSLI